MFGRKCHYIINLPSAKVDPENVENVYCRKRTKFRKVKGLYYCPYHAKCVKVGWGYAGMKPTYWKRRDRV